MDADILFTHSAQVDVYFDGSLSLDSNRRLDDNDQPLFELQGMIGFFGAASATDVQRGLENTFPKAQLVFVVDEIEIEIPAQRRLRTLALKIADIRHWREFSISFEDSNSVNDAFYLLSLPETSLSLCIQLEDPCRSIIFSNLMAFQQPFIAQTYSIENEFDSSSRHHFFESGSSTSATEPSISLTCVIFIILILLSTLVLLGLIFAYRLFSHKSDSTKKSVSNADSAKDEDNMKVGKYAWNSTPKNAERALTDIPLSPLTAYPSPRFFGGKISPSETSFQDELFYNNISAKALMKLAPNLNSNNRQIEAQKSNSFHVSDVSDVTCDEAIWEVVDVDSL